MVAVLDEVPAGLLEVPEHKGGVVTTGDQEVVAQKSAACDLTLMTVKLANGLDGFQGVVVFLCSLLLTLGVEFEAVHFRVDASTGYQVVFGRLD